MKIYVDEDERYPDFKIKDGPARFYQELEVDETTVAIWKNVFEAYELIQQQILDLCSEKYHPAESE